MKTPTFWVVCAGLLVFCTIPRQTFAIITPLDCSDNRTGHIAGAGQKDTFSFTANVGERIILRMSNGSSSMTPRLQLFDPDGGILSDQNAYPLARIDVSPVSKPGTYLAVASNYSGSSTGNYGISLQIVKPICAIVIPGGDYDISGNLNGFGAMQAFTFSANEGERLILRASNGSTSISPQMELYAPDGSKVQENSAYPLARLDVASAPATGEYVLVVMDNDGESSGSFGLALQIVKPSFAAALSGCNAGISVNLSGFGAIQAFTFSANEGERLILRASNGSTSISPQMELYAPNGLKLLENSSYPLARLDVASAPATGEYVLVVMDDDGESSGSFGLGLQIVKPACATLLPACDADISGNLSGFGAIQAFTFSANEGERLILRASNGSTSISPQMELYAPNGLKLLENSSYPLARLDVASAPATGEYVLVVMDDDGESSGSFGLGLQIVKPACATPITDCPFNAPVNLNQVAEMQAFTFYAAAGAALNIQMDNGPSSVTPTLELYNPSNNLLATVSTYPTAFLNITAPTSGVYRLVVMDDDGENSGVCTLSITGCTANANPCTAPALTWKNTPTSVCPGSSVTLVIQNADAGFNFELFQDSVSTQQVKIGTGADLQFEPITVVKVTTFSLRVVAKADPACVFDLSPPLTVGVSGLSFSTTVKDESAFDEDGRITICVRGGQAPFTLMYEPHRGDSTAVPPFDSCTAGFEIINLRAGHYIVVVRESSGCSATQIVQVGNPDKRRIGFPEKPVLTPNGDGYNDKLVYEGLFEFPDDNEIVIYNRYGSILFQADPYRNDWDAIYEGRPLPADTYFYRLRVQSGEVEQIYTGFITVIR